MIKCQILQYKSVLFNTSQGGNWVTEMWPVRIEVCYNVKYTLDSKKLGLKKNVKHLIKNF